MNVTTQMGRDRVVGGIARIVDSSQLGAGRHGHGAVGRRRCGQRRSLIRSLVARAPGVLQVFDVYLDMSLHTPSKTLGRRAS